MFIGIIMIKLNFDGVFLNYVFVVGLIIYLWGSFDWLIWILYLYLRWCYWGYLINSLVVGGGFLLKGKDVFCRLKFNRRLLYLFYLVFMGNIFKLFFKILLI